MRKKWITFLASISIFLTSCDGIENNSIKYDSSYGDFSVPDNASRFTPPQIDSGDSSQSQISSVSKPESESKPSLPDVVDDNETRPSKVKYALADLPDDYQGKSFAEESKTKEFYVDLATDFAISEIEKQGYDVFRAYAILKENDASSGLAKNKYAYGLAFTKGELYDADEEIYSCGFIQVIVDESEKGRDKVSVEREINKDDVKDGVVVYGADNTEKTYIVESSVILEGFSGIYYNRFFSYKQKSTFSMLISVKDNEKKNYDEDLDLYDFDLEKYLYKASIFREEKDINAFTLYGNDASAAYQKAVDAINGLIELQNETGIDIKMNNIFVFDINLVKASNVKEQVETVNGILKEKLDDILLEENQYLTIDADGNISIQTDYTTDMSQGRVAKGLINTLISLSMFAGSFAILVGGTILTGGVAGFVLATAAANVSIYSFSNLVAGVQDIYYGLKGDSTTEAYNPVEKSFQTVLNDNELGSNLYHLWGCLSSVAMTFVNPISGSIQKAQYCGYGIVKTALQVTRTVVVTLVKGVIAGGCAQFVSNIATKIAESVTGDEIASALIGYASGMLTGMYVYGKLHQLDLKYDLSGLGGHGNVGHLSDSEIESERKKMGTQRDITQNQSRRAGKLIDQTGDGQKSLLLERDYSSSSKAKQEYYRDATVSDINYSQNTKTVVKIIDEAVMAMSMKNARFAATSSDRQLNGYYDPNIDVIYINKDIADKDGTLTLYTIAHLMRHAHQMKYADFNSPILKSLREGQYQMGDGKNAAEKDAENFANYYLNRANNALNYKTTHPNETKVPFVGDEFEIPSDYYEGGR